MHRKFNKMFKDHMKNNSFKTPKCLKVEITEFVNDNHVNAQRNRENSLVSLKTTTIEANDVYIEKSKYGTFRAYIDHNVGYKNKKVLVRCKNNSNQQRSFCIDLNDLDSQSLNYIFGYKLDIKYDPELYKYYVNSFCKDIVDLKENESSMLNALEEAKPEYTKAVYKNIIGDLMRNDQSSLNELCVFLGYKIQKIFYYREIRSFDPQYIKSNKKIVEFGYMTNNTYNSLPATIRVSLVNGIKTVKLCDLGVESKGNYSHDDKMSIKPEDVELVKKFNNSFNKKKKEFVK